MPLLLLLLYAWPYAWPPLLPPYTWPSRPLSTLPALPYCDGIRGTGGSGDAGCVNDDRGGREGPGDGVRARARSRATAGADGAEGRGGCDCARRAFALALSLSGREATLCRLLRVRGPWPEYVREWDARGPAAMCNIIVSVSSWRRGAQWVAVTASRRNGGCLPEDMRGLPLLASRSMRAMLCGREPARSHWSATLLRSPPP